VDDAAVMAALVPAHVGLLLEEEKGGERVVVQQGPGGGESHKASADYTNLELRRTAHVGHARRGRAPRSPGHRPQLGLEARLRSPNVTVGDDAGPLRCCQAKGAQGSGRLEWGAELARAVQRQLGTHGLGVPRRRRQADAFADRARHFDPRRASGL
jgi:hypothetical protein